MPKKGCEKYRRKIWKFLWYIKWTLGQSEDYKMVNLIQTREKAKEEKKMSKKMSNNMLRLFHVFNFMFSYDFKLFPQYNGMLMDNFFFVYHNFFKLSTLTNCIRFYIAQFYL